MAFLLLLSSRPGADTKNSARLFAPEKFGVTTNFYLSDAPTFGMRS